MDGPPHGVDLVAFARVSAAVSEGDRPLAEVLEQERLSEAQWAEVTVFWTRRMAEDGRSPEPRVAIAFSEAFARAQDANKAVPSLSADAWAGLITEIEEHPNGALPVLAMRGLGLADYARLIRHWARALGSDPALAAAYEAARTRLAEAKEGV